MTPQIGVSFSPHQAQVLGLDETNALSEVLGWPIEYVRLGSYWSELEHEPGKYDFSSLLNRLGLCESAHKKVVLTVGVKSFRWPEFYFPTHVHPDLQDSATRIHLLQFISHIVKAVKRFRCIKYWQVENEPLDPSGPDQATIPAELLQQECELVRSLDDRPLLLTLWGNDMPHRRTLSALEPVGDRIGIDLYYHLYLTSILGKNIYRQLGISDEALFDHLRQTNTPVWIAELQAEPWEKDMSAYQADNPVTMTPRQLQQNWERATQLPVETVLFWGVEYWLWRKKQGDTRYTDWIESFTQ